MQGHWINQAPYYRCRYPTEYALANNIPHPRNIYLRQDTFETDVHRWLASLFIPDHLNHTIDQMMAGQHAATDTTAADAATTKIADANLTLARYRAALAGVSNDHGVPTEFLLFRWPAEAGLGV